MSFQYIESSYYILLLLIFISSIIICVSYSPNQAVSTLWELTMFHYFYVPYSLLCPRIIQMVLFYHLLENASLAFFPQQQYTLTIIFLTIKC